MNSGAEILKQNLEHFVAQHPEISVDWSRIQLPEVFKRFRIEDTPDGSVNFYEGSQLRDSTEDDFLENLKAPPAEARVLILEGFGLGTTLAWAIQNYGTRVKKFVIVEPDVARFYQALALTDFENLFEDKRIHWIIGQTKDQFFARCYNDFRLPPNSLFMDSFGFIRHPGATSEENAYFHEIRDEWEAARLQIRRNYGGRRDSLDGLKNVFENLEWIQRTPGIDQLKDAFIGRPAVLVSAGPSLKKSLAALKALQDKAIIISSDATVSVLLNAGIEPHFAMTMERGLGSKKYFEALRGKEFRTHLVSYPLVPSGVIEAFPGPHWMVWRDYASHYYLSQSMPRGSLRSSSSVAHFGLKFAEYIGCSKIVLVGQDLSYDPESFQSHVAGIAYDEWSQPTDLKAIEADLQKKGLGSLIQVPGNMDDLVPTNSTYFSFMKEFSWEATISKAEILNCTDGGAKIPNISWSRLESGTAGWETLSETFERIASLRKPVKDAFNAEELRSTLQLFEKRLVALASECERMSLEQNVPAEFQRKFLELVLKSKQELEDAASFYCFVLETNAREYLDIENELSKLSNFAWQNASERYRFLGQWFEAMASALGDLLALMPSAFSTKSHKQHPASH